MSINAENFAHNENKWILKKVNLKKMWYCWPFTRAKFICSGNIDELLFLRVNTAEIISLPEFI